jgi:hypothetical protein
LITSSVSLGERRIWKRNKGGVARNAAARGDGNEVPVQGVRINLDGANASEKRNAIGVNGILALTQKHGLVLIVHLVGRFDRRQLGDERQAIR